MQNPINTTPITQFAQLLKAAELNQQKEIKIPIQQARLISLALLETIDKLNRDYESMFNQLSTPKSEVQSIMLDGGSFLDVD